MTNGSYRIVELIILKNNYRNLMISFHSKVLAVWTRIITLASHWPLVLRLYYRFNTSCTFNASSCKEKGF